MTYPLLNRTNHPAIRREARILQFGEGNFLRAFVDWMVHTMNQKGVFDGGVVVVQPIAQGLVNMLNDQDGLYTLYLTGLKEGQAAREPALIDCIQRGIDPYADFSAFLETAGQASIEFVISNTTEAGITFVEQDRLEDAPPGSFPGKLTRWLWERYQALGQAQAPGVTHLPCELIDKNGDKLRAAVLQYAGHWNLPEAFSQWVQQSCTFCNTLVDRIVPGYPKDRMEEIRTELGYDDKLVVEGEQFHLWVIEAPESVQRAFPAPAAGLNVLYTPDLTPYRTRKVRILNGAHTAMVPVGYLSGIATVKEVVEDPITGPFIRDLVFEEIIPTLDLPVEELEYFAGEVLGRFRNPFIKHFLISIALNSISKYETRVLPSLLEYARRKGELPSRMVFSLAATIRFYAGDWQGETIPLNDEPAWMEWFQQEWKRVRTGEQTTEGLVREVLARNDMWGMDLNTVAGLSEKTAAFLQLIDREGMPAALRALGG